MSKTFFIEDPNGTILSTDGQRRFSKLDGKAGYEFVHTAEGKGRRFLELVDLEDEDNILKIEVPSYGMKGFRQDERHEQYVADTARKYDYSILSLNSGENEDSEETLDAFIADENVDVERDALHQCDLETLRKALRTLSEEELALITALYLRDEPMTEREYAKEKNLAPMTIHDRKIRILAKLKKYFEKF